MIKKKNVFFGLAYILNSIELKPIISYNGENATLNCYQAGPEHNSFQQNITNPTSILLDYALENDFTLNEDGLQEGYFQTVKMKGVSRNVKVLHKSTWTFLTISVTASGIKKMGLHYKPVRGVLSPATIQILLKLLYIKNNTALINNWMETSINLLLYEAFNSQSYNQPGKKLLWHDAVLIYRAVENLKNDQSSLSPETELAEKTGLKRYRFQKACRQLYGLSMKEILYALKMEEILKMVTLSDQSLKEISRLEGFNNYDNFITAFRNYFDTTPALLRRATFRR